MAEVLSAEQIAILKSLPVMRLRMNSVCASHEALRAENERLRALFKRVKEIADNPWKWEKAYVNFMDYAGFEVGLVIAAKLYPVVHDAIGIDPVPLDCDLSGITPALATSKERTNG